MAPTTPCSLPLRHPCLRRRHRRRPRRPHRRHRSSGRWTNYSGPPPAPARAVATVGPARAGPMSWGWTHASYFRSWRAAASAYAC
eukprot:scaffold72110_cov78-Phaeocystis_antarctica.AAC.2